MTETLVIRRSPWKKRLSILYLVMSGGLYLAFLVFVLINRAYFGADFFQQVNPFITTPILIFLAALLSYRRPENPISWLFIIVAVLSQATALPIVLSILLARGLAPGPITFALGILGANVTGLTFAMIAYIFILFPSGRLPSRRWSAVHWMFGLIVLSVIGNIAFSIVQGNFNIVADISGILANPFSIITLTLAFCLVLLALASLNYRFRNGSYIERQQIKWVLLAVLLWAFVGLLPLLPPLRQLIVIWALIAPILPISVVVAILRYRLYDIDIIIRRTLQYGLLTTILAAVYFGLVILLQGSAGAITGQVESPLIVVLSTLGIAAVFNPLRRRLQDLVDRQFYRAKFDAEKTLADFAAAARDEVDPEALGNEILAVVAETIQPERISLWLRKVSPRS